MNRDDYYAYHEFFYKKNKITYPVNIELLLENYNYKLVLKKFSTNDHLCIFPEEKTIFLSKDAKKENKRYLLAFAFCYLITNQKIILFTNIKKCEEKTLLNNFINPLVGQILLPQNNSFLRTDKEVIFWGINQRILKIIED